MSEALARQSYRAILKSTAIMGGASLANGVLGLARNKVAAMVLGPAGLGYIGIYTNIMQAGSMMAALGTSAAGSRRVAAVAENEGLDSLSHVRKALFWLTVLLSLAGSLGCFLLRDMIAKTVLHDESRTHAIGWLSLGVFLTVAAGSQQALLTGLRKISDYARVQVISSLLSAIAGIAALLWLGADGIVAFVLVGPLFLFLCGHWYVARLGRNRAVPTPVSTFARLWNQLIHTGLSFLVAGLVGLLGLLMVRSQIQANLGPHALGQFQAAWFISTTYVGLVLNAMATDYMPRLAASIADKPAVVRLVNEQAEVALLVAAPVMIAFMALAPWLMTLFYSSEFSDAVAVFRLQIFGDLFRVAGWPLGLVLAVTGSGRGFMLVETLSMGLFVIASTLLLSRWGIAAVGASFAAMYLFYMIIAMTGARRSVGFRWTLHGKLYLMIVFAAALLIFTVGLASNLVAALLGVSIAACMGCYCLIRLGTKADLPGVAGKLARQGNLLLKRTWARGL